MKVQIPDWHGDGWQELTGPNATDDPQTAAETAATNMIIEAAAYAAIGGEPITVYVDDGAVVRKFTVETEPTFNCHATEKAVEDAMRRRESP